MIKKSPKNPIKLYKNKISKRLPFIYKFLISIAIFWGLALFYFVVLVSSSPRSIDYITHRIQKNLDENFSQKIKISKTFIKFTGYGSFHVSAHDIMIEYQDSQIDDSNQIKVISKSLKIPKIEAEFSLLDFILFKFNPSKIKIFKPQIVIDNTKNLKQFIGNNNDIATINSSENEQLIVMINILSSLRKSKNPIENLEIEDGKILFQTPKINSELIIKSAKISSKINGESLDIFSQSNIYFSKNKSDFKIDSNCKLSKLDGLKCDLNLFNFLPNSIVEFHEFFKDLEKINTAVNGSVNLSINNKLSTLIKFNLRADKGNFEFKDFFKDKIEFRNMKIIGEYNGANKILNLNSIQANLISNIANQTEILNPQLNLSLAISMLENSQIKYDFAINLKNVLTNEIDRFWPINLSQNGVRDWVINHLSNGTISDSSAKFSLLMNPTESNLQDISAQLNFSEIDLNYDKNFPAIKKINGIAEFTKNSMKISINSGNVLNSKISIAEIAIDDFNMPINILKIHGVSTGKASDGLKHAHNSQEFHLQADKYLKGSAENVFEILLPLKDDLELKDIYLNINSSLRDLDNQYVKGKLEVSTKKEIDSNIFNIAIDLTDSEIQQKELQIYKKLSDKMSLKFSLDVANDKMISFKNIFYGNPEYQYDVSANKISGNIDISRIDGDLINLNIQNKNINKNNYSIIYNKDINKSLIKLSLRGKYLNLSEVFNNKFSSNSTNNSINKYQINISLDNILLANNKNFNRFNLNLNCQNKICQSGYLKSSISKNKKNPKNIDLKIIKNIAENSTDEKIINDYIIDGQIQDIGYVLEALNLSKLIANGDLKIKILQNIIDKKLVLDGTIKSLSDITIFENEAVKKLTKNDLLSKIKDKIFSSEKTTFGSMVIDFSYSNSEIILKSLIANNFKIGITAKGNINLADNSMKIKGMIIPGYIVNSLFGLGNLPVLGGVISGILTGGDGGGIFSIRYEYLKKSTDNEGQFSTNKVSAFVPSSISSLFD